MNAPLPDAEARQRITQDTEHTLFVEAGAGSRKTSSLIGRITQLVLTAGVPLRGIAAVTFTEKAGAELRDRLRAELEGHPGPRGEQALDDLDSAAIGTLHSFAPRILAEHPIEARLPPLIEVADELSSAVAFDERWSEQRRQLLDDDTVADALLLAMSAGVTLDNLRSLSRLFGADWDLLDERVLVGDGPEPAQLPDLAQLIAKAAILSARAAECADPDDKFLPRLLAIGSWGELLGSAGDPGQQLEALRTAEALKTSYGKAGNWGGKDALTGLRDDCKQLQAAAAAAVDAVLESTLRTLSRWVARRVLEAADARRAAGRLEFHDLLVIARNTLRHNAKARDTLQRRYPRLLLDEFQDTDPIQIELAVRIAGGAAASQERWEDVVVPAGYVTIAVVNSALKSDLSTFAQDSLLVADEVHRYGAEQFQSALRAGYQRRLGLTATLERSDDAIETILRPYFGPTALTVGFDRAIREKVVAPFRLVMAPIAMSADEEDAYGKLSRQIVNGLKMLRSAGALNNGSGPSMIQQLGRLGGAAGRLGAAARSAQSGMRYRRLLLANLAGKLDAVEELAEMIGASQGAVLFTQSKELAEQAAVRLREWGVTASALHSDMSVDERRASLQGLEDGHIQALAAPKLLDEGIDLPTIDLGVVMTASRSRRQMVQRLGRVIRRKADGRPVDFVILYAAGTVEDPESGVHEGFFDLVGEVATNRLVLELGWSANDLL